MNPKARFDAALEATKDWHASLPEATQFCPWPSDLRWCTRSPNLLPCAQQICAEPGATCPASEPLLVALQAVAPLLEWRHTYTADEVGLHFLDHFGWFELVGPSGHFVSYQTRITVGYWGRGLWYDWHDHQAEELYTIVSGEADLHVENASDLRAGPGMTRWHGSGQSHALATTDQPVVALVFWRGEGLADNPRMSA